MKMNTENGRYLTLNRDILALAGFLCGFLPVFGTELPGISLAGNDEQILITKVLVGASTSAYPHRRLLKEPGGALGRTRWSVHPQDIAALIPPSIEGPSIELDRAPSGFDLWDAIKQLNPPAASSLVLSFSIHTQLTKAVLGIGCEDEFFVFVNGMPTYASVGYREYIRNQVLVEVPLTPGGNVVQVYCRRAEIWSQAPTSHEHPAWRISVEAHGNADAAWRVNRRTNFHMADTPIVNSLDDLRFDTILPGCEAVTLWDLDGAEISRGTLEPGGSVRWGKRPQPEGPLLVFLGMGDKHVEAILVTRGENIDAVCQKILERHTAGPANPWRRRSHHLLKPEFRDQRDWWWARKLVLSLAKVAEDPSDTAQRSVFQRYEPAQIEFAEYESSVDQGTQYYRIYHGSEDAERARTPILVIIGTVHASVRPYLESVEVANLRDTEDIAGLALEHGLTVVWPGMVDSDYGGKFAIKQLEECLDAVADRMKLKEPHFYLMGICSSGMAAISYASQYPVSGLLLQSPVVARRRFRWLHGLTPDWFAYPRSVLTAEQPLAKIERLAKVPVFLSFSTNIPGHGDKQGSVLLADRLRGLDGDVEMHWPVAERDFLWGERARIALVPFFSWVAKKHAQGVAVAHSPKPAKNTVQSIKDALLKGFVVERSDDAVLAAWFQRWRELWLGFRGAEWRYQTPDRTAGHTLVKARVLTGDDLGNIRRGVFFEGNGQLKAEPVDARQPLWGFRLRSDREGETVEVFRSPEATDLPPAELMADGCCKGALWKRTAEGWKLHELWL